jgi:SAM-dependent methyltransferase
MSCGNVAAVAPQDDSASPWLGFWERANRIYVSDRHRAVHYRRVADDLLSVLPPCGPKPSGGGPSRAAPAVLDYGCGEALEAARVAARIGRLYLYDAARPTRARLVARFAGIANVTVLDEAGLAALAPASLDLILVNSVIQYLSREELGALLARARAWLRADGLLVLADVIAPDATALADARALLGTAWRHGFLGAALLGLAATFFSNYRRLRAAAGLATFAEPEMAALLRAAGFAAERRERNFGFNPERMTFLARPLK